MTWNHNHYSNVANPFNRDETINTSYNALKITEPYFLHHRHCSLHPLIMCII